MTQCQEVESSTDLERTSKVKYLASVKDSATVQHSFLGVDSKLPDQLGRAMMNGITVLITFTAITIIGGWAFAVIAAIMGLMIYFSMLY